VIGIVHLAVRVTDIIPPAIQASGHACNFYMQKDSAPPTPGCSAVLVSCGWETELTIYSIPIALFSDFSRYIFSNCLLCTPCMNKCCVCDRELLNVPFLLLLLLSKGCYTQA
jgi:hypothetical protein